MLDLWKPLIVRSKTHKPVICDVFGCVLKRPYRPFVIFYDDNEKCYYYLRARSVNSYDKNQKPYIVKPNKYEVFVHQNEHPEEELFQVDSYVDCSQIFKCDKALLESLVNVKSESYLSTSKLEPNQIDELKNNILKAIFEQPPYLSIIEVKEENNTMLYNSLYLNKELFKKENNLSKYNYDSFRSENNKDDIFSFNRYQNGINFCLKFLKEYYPKDIEKFKQKLSKTIF